jgi:c-di-GMP-binding flagellar brake protein YcgR
MQDKRRYKRYSVDFMDIKGNMVFASSVKIVDISVSGVLLQADRRLNIGSEYTLNIIHEVKRLTVKAVVVWSSLHEKIKDARGYAIQIYTAGLKFVDMTEGEKAEIVRFIKVRTPDILKETDLSQPDGLRLHLRAPLENQEEAVLRCQDSYRITKLSLGGMLIISDCPLELEDQVPMEISLDEEKQIKFLGRVASCFLIENTKPEIYELGIEFLGMTDKDRQILNEFIKLLERRDVSSFSL